MDNFRNSKTNQDPNSVFKKAQYDHSFQNEQDPELIRLSQGMDMMNLNNLSHYRDSLTPSEQLRGSDANFKDCLSSDLLQRLEQSSPIKNQRVFKQSRDFSLMSSQIVEEENLPRFSGKEVVNKNREDNSEEEQYLNQDFRQPKNYRLKSQLVNEGPQLAETGNGEDFPIMQNYNMDNFFKSNMKEQKKTYSQTNPMQASSPNVTSNKGKKHVRNDSSPILSYYDGTTAYLSQNVINEMARQQSQEPNMSEKMNNKGGHRQHGSDRKIKDNMNMNMNNNNYPEEFFQNQKFLQQQMMAGYGEHPGLNREDDNESQDDEELQREYMMNLHLNNQMNQMNQMSQMNPNMQFQNDDDESYIVEMFGKRGWICDSCNNFNYETRLKCNRCGINKSPKRNIKGRGKFAGNQRNNEMMGEDDEFNRKKKPFVERVGDWVCIKCKNLNFSFRVICNRCQLLKVDSEGMYEKYMSNLMQYVKINEAMQSKLLLQQSPPQTQSGNLVNNNNFNINNNYYESQQSQGQMPMMREKEQMSMMREKEQMPSFNGKKSGQKGKHNNYGTHSGHNGHHGRDQKMLYQMQQMQMNQMNQLPNNYPEFMNENMMMQNFLHNPHYEEQ